mmetsp:Transcript_14221/g.55998  ORF Transcript_14221/g.55998 Transcript_14221/m.55998 type:complete len:232 (+) Transcript_14221:514-1209(+)
MGGTGVQLAGRRLLATADGAALADARRQLLGLCPELLQRGLGGGGRRVQRGSGLRLHGHVCVGGRRLHDGRMHRCRGSDGEALDGLSRGRGSSVLLDGGRRAHRRRGGRVGDVELGGDVGQVVVQHRVARPVPLEAVDHLGVDAVHVRALAREALAVPRQEQLAHLQQLCNVHLRRREHYTAHRRPQVVWAMFAHVHHLDSRRYGLAVELHDIVDLHHEVVVHQRDHPHAG